MAARTRPPRLGYVGGWLGHQNLGDEAMFAASRRLFPCCGVIPYASSLPMRTLQLSRWAQLCVAGVLGGGTLIGGNVSGFATVLNAFPITFVFGTGVANPGFWSGRNPSFRNNLKAWKPVLERCGYIGVRGPTSAEILAEMGLANVEVIGDPALVFADDFPNDRVERTSPSLGLNVGQSLGEVWGSEDAICKQFVQLAKRAKHHGWGVRWFVVWRRDLETTLRVAEASDTLNAVYQVYNDPIRFLDLVRPLTAFVGMKLHATVLATCAYVPSIMIEYRPKCRDYMKSINQEDVTVRSDALDADTVWETVRPWEYAGHERRQSLYQAVRLLSRLQRLRANEIVRNTVWFEHTGSRKG